MYVAQVELFAVRFPVEELLFLVVGIAPAIVATYSIYKNWKRI